MIKSKLAIWLKRPDDLLFWLLWFIHLLPLWVFTPFLTVDGPAHLYNSRLLLELFKGNATVAEFYLLNPVLQPNMLAHVLLAALMFTGIPALMAEKILLSLLVALLPLAFRQLLRSCCRNTTGEVLYIFPFVYGFLFFMGFYNFLLGVVLGIFGLAVWIKFFELNAPPRIVLLSGFIGLLVLFAHVYAFAWYAIFSGMILIFRVLRRKHHGFSARDLSMWLLAWALPLLLAVYFLIGADFVNGESQRLALSKIWQMVYEVQPAKGLEYGKANIYTQWLFWLLALRSIMFIVALPKHLGNTRMQATFLAFVMLTMALLVLPDGNAMAGFVSQRTGLIWFIALFVLLATIETRLWLAWIGRAVVVMVSVALLAFYMHVMRNDQALAREVVYASRKVPEGAVVYVENVSKRLLHTHLSNYLGVNKGLIISENYQAELPYFPVIWNRRNLPVLHLGEMSKPVRAWPVAGGLRNLQADYVLVINNGTDEPWMVGNLAKQHYFRGLYELVYQDNGQRVSLLRRLPISIYDL